MSYREDSYDQNYRNGNGYYHTNNHNSTPMRPSNSLPAPAPTSVGQRQRHPYPSNGYYDDPQSYHYQYEYEYEQQPYQHAYHQPVYPSPPLNKHISHQNSPPNPYYSPRPSKSPYQTEMSRNNSTPVSNSNTVSNFGSNSNSNLNATSNLTPNANKKLKISSGKPIIKNYILNPIQNNYLTEINKIKSDKKIMESFKLIHLKNDSNSNSKLTKLESINALSNKVKDPRSNSNSLYVKSYSKSYYKPNSVTYIPNYKYDKYSVGDKPSNQIVIWNFPSTISSLIIKNNFTSFGKIKEIKLIDDPLTAVPLGICLVSFDNNGDAEDSHKSAINAIKLTNKKLLIQSRLIRCGLNENNELYNIIYKKTLESRKEKQRQRQEEDFLKQKQQQLEKIKELRITKQKQYEKLQQEYDNQLKKKELNNSVNSTTKSSVKLSAHDKHILPLSTCSLPPRFDKYILNRPFIFISDKYVTTSLVNSSDIRRLLINYEVERILTHRSGFYVIFQDIDKAIECFDKEDGRRFKEFVVYMTVFIPDDKMKDTRVGTMGAISKAKEIIRRELSAYLLKDLREKIVGKLVLDVLNSDKMIEKAKEVKSRKEKEKNSSSNNNNSSNTPVTTVRVVKKVDLGIFKRRERKNFVPISHALNENADGSDDYDSEDGKKKHKFNEDEEEDDDNQYNIKPKKKKLTVDKSSTESDDDDDDEIKNGKENVVSSMSEATTPEFDEKNRKEDGESKNKVKSENEIETEEEEPEPEEGIEEAETSYLDDIYRPSIGKPIPVYTDHFETFKPTLDTLREFIKDDEDFNILKKISKEKTVEPEPVKDINYWAWKHLECKKLNDELTHNNDEEVEDSETFDFAQEIIDNKELKSKTGSFRTDGYHKIPDKLKREYLLHRRKLHNKINPVKHEEDTELSNNITTTSHNNIQSSRVNRANNRRFAADISAQKQILGVENDLLDLNQLNKRKKPVQFARSAIHNWGLYALEPIAAREMIIEYVGERIRQQVAEVREKKYLRSGIGSSYLFRIDENTVIDASKKGGIARFINHCCEPSCTAKIIKVDGKKRIVIYALRDIKKNEELTYDYKFEREFNDEERIPCLCGVSACKGYLN